MNKNTEIKILKKALQDAIFNINRTTAKCTDYGPAGSTYECDWTDTVKGWAKLCDLDLDQHDPFHSGH